MAEPFLARPPAENLLSSDLLVRSNRTTLVIRMPNASVSRDASRLKNFTVQAETGSQVDVTRLLGASGPSRR